MTDKTPRIIQGKPGAATEGRTFIATFAGQDAARAVLEGAGSMKLGEKGDLTLWGMPAGMDLPAIEVLCAAAVAAQIIPEPEATPEPEAVAAPVPSVPAVPDTPTAAAVVPAVPSVPTVSKEEVAEAPLAKNAAITSAPAPARAVEAAKAEPEPVKPNPATVSQPHTRSDGNDPLSFGWRVGMSVAEWDALRIPVPAGSVNLGDVIEVNGVEREIVMLGGTLNPQGDALAALRARFPDQTLEEGKPLQLVMWAGEPEPEMSLDGPG